MKISRFNHEGYYDPTPHCALTNIVREQRRQECFRPVVYICSPVSGDQQRNMENTRRYCRFAVESGAIPLAPQLYFPQFMDGADRKEYELALFMDSVLLTKCAELWVFGTGMTHRMAREIEKAGRRGMPIRRFTTGCKEVT